MGIANTTASAALVCAFTGPTRRRPPAAAPGSTTRRWPARSRWCAAVAGCPARPRPRRRRSAVLAEVGGLEHAALAGFVLGAAAARVPVLLDGVIAGSAALVAAALCPTALEYAVAGHVSAEPGHALALDALGLRPLLGLDLRLGEGTGALLALPLVAERGPGAARRRDVRLGRRDREELMNATPVDPGPVVYPVGLRLHGRQVVVVGGGQVAHRRVAGLLEARAPGSRSSAPR